jgi:hypothetical protein
MSSIQSTLPIQIGRIHINRADTGCQVMLGDLNGDGRMEFVDFQSDGGIDDRYVPHEAQCLTASDLSGNVLWQVGKPNPDIKGSDSDHPGSDSLTSTEMVETK